MSGGFTESAVEQPALARLGSTGWSVKDGADISPGEPAAESDEPRQVVLAQRLRDALARLNPALPAETLDDGVRKLTQPKGAELVARSRALHRLLVDGVTENEHARRPDLVLFVNGLPLAVVGLESAADESGRVATLTAVRAWLEPSRTIAGAGLARPHTSDQPTLQLAFSRDPDLHSAAVDA